MLQRSGEVLLTIINEILDFSKIEAGMLAIESSVFDLRLLIEKSMSCWLPGPKTASRT